MALRNSITTYGTVAKSFHWVIALLIVALLTVGFLMKGMPVSPDKFKVYGLHKSFGITVLALAGLRLLWKATNIVPSLPASLPKWERYLAHIGHALLYALMITMPLSGWAMSSAGGLPVSLFGWFTLPDLIGPDKELRPLLRQSHTVLAWGLIIMVSLHALAALLHHFYYRNNVLRRMLPFTKEDHPYAQNSDTMAGC